MSAFGKFLIVVAILTGSVWRFIRAMFFIARECFLHPLSEGWVNIDTGERFPTDPNPR